MPQAAAGWYDDGAGRQRWWDGQQWTDQYQDQPPLRGPSDIVEHIRADAAAGGQPRPAPAGMSYVVLQVVLKEKFLSAGSQCFT